MQKTGDQGHRVEVLQRLLVHRGLKIGVDGTFGPETEAAVKTFQSSQKLDADGMVGDLTWPAVLVQVKKGDEGDLPDLAQLSLLGGTRSREPTAPMGRAGFEHAC